MMKITNGVDVITVTEGAYKGIFKAQGFFPVENTQEKAPVSVEATEITAVASEVDPGEVTTEGETQQSEDKNLVSESEPEDESEDLSEIPLSEMTNRQLTAYAHQLGVDIKGLKSKKEVIARIRAVL